MSSGKKFKKDCWHQVMGMPWQRKKYHWREIYKGGGLITGNTLSKNPKLSKTR